MAEFPLLPIPTPATDERPGGRGGPSDVQPPGRERQRERHDPAFQRLRDVFGGGRDPVMLRDDPAGIAPERALVFDVAGEVADFQRAVWRVPGLELLVDEEAAFDTDEDFRVKDTRKGREGTYRTDRPIKGRLYVAMPDLRALRELLSLWDRYERGESAPTGFAPWFASFDHLVQLRAWGPADRVPDDTISWLDGQIEAHVDPVRVEIERWSFQGAERRERAERLFRQAVSAAGGKVLHAASIPDIAYEAALVDVPIAEVRRLRDREDSPLSVCDDIMVIRPQSTAEFSTAVDPLGPGPAVESPPAFDLPPIAALLDGVPVPGHRLLDGRMILDDPDDLDDLSVVAERRHGTEMASLILHGDRNWSASALSRPIYSRPILYAPGGGARERPHPDRLLLDTIYRAVVRMKAGDAESGPAAPDVFLVNLSLGDENRPFTGPMSPWGRLLDHLADQFGILFLVSAGNIRGPLSLPAFEGMIQLEQATLEERERATFESLAAQRAHRTLLSPAEALNVVTVGAWHEDSVDAPPNSSLWFSPYGEEPGPNVTSAMGLGYRKAIKPDIFMPGGRERLRMVAGGEELKVRAAESGQVYGLRAAVPGAGGRLDQEGLTAGTSAATALATRAAHRIFDALTDETNGAILDGVDPAYYPVIVKALLVHRARWGEKASLLDEIYGPKGQGKHVERKDNIARVLGYGRPRVKEALTCAANRATLVGYGSVEADGSARRYRAPLPGSLERVREPRAITITLAWFSPVNVRHAAYRRAKLEIQSIDFKNAAGVDRAALQPSDKSVPRGTLFHVRYEGRKAVPFVDDGHVGFRVFCSAPTGQLDRKIKYGLAVTIEAGAGIPVYQEIRQRLGIQPLPQS